MNRRQLAVLLALCMLNGVASAESVKSPIAAGQAASLAASCSSCHGAGSRAESAIATLSNLSAAEIRSALLEFRDDKRAATLMNRIAKGYSDDEIAAIAKHLGKP